MAFRIVKTLVLAGSGSIGDNWTSIPFISPYRTVADFCAKTGLVAFNASTGTPGATVTVIDPGTGTPSIGTCGTASASSVLLVPGWGIKIRQPNVTGARTKIVIVGAHDPALRISVSKKRTSGAADTVGYWFSVPPNTTAVTYGNLCHQVGITTSQGGFVRIDPSTGAVQIYGCTTLAETTKLTSGEAVEVLVGTPRSFTPGVY